MLSQANPTVGKDQPPDLATLVPSDATVVADPPEKQAPSQASEKNHISVNNQPTTVKGINSLWLLEEHFPLFFFFFLANYSVLKKKRIML